MMIEPIFPKPSEVRRSFAHDNPIGLWKKAAVLRKSVPKRAHQGPPNKWPRQLDYEFLETCKELIASVPHPTNHLRRRKWEYRISRLRWSRGAYMDLRLYKDGHGTSVGILLHQDLLQAILPVMSRLEASMAMEDAREESQKAKIELHEYW